MFRKWGIPFSFLLTVLVARSISAIAPWFHVTIAGVHLHHYVYGIFLLTAAGYLALVFRGPRATSWIALLYGCGVGLTFDEFGFWINPVFQRGVRWSYHGITTVVAGLVVVSLIPIIGRRRNPPLSMGGPAEPDQEDVPTEGRPVGPVLT